MNQIPRRRRLVEIAACLTLISVVFSGCSSDEPDPAQQRRDRVETRLSETFSQDQADCIVSAIDETTLRALDRTADLPPDSPPMLTYTVAVRACVGGSVKAPPSTTSDGTTTTTTEG